MLEDTKSTSDFVVLFMSFSHHESRLACLWQNRFGNRRLQFVSSQLRAQTVISCLGCEIMTLNDGDLVHHRKKELQFTFKIQNIYLCTDQPRHVGILV